MASANHTTSPHARAAYDASSFKRWDEDHDPGAVLLADGSVALTDDLNMGSGPFGLDDASGNELLSFSSTGSAANHLQITNNTAAKAPHLSAAGDDANISIQLVPKGTGNVYTSRLHVVDADDTTSPDAYLGVGTGKDGKFFSVGDDVYLDQTDEDSDFFLRANDGGTMKTFLEIDASEALLKLGQDDADVTLGKLAQAVKYSFRPETTEEWDLGSPSFRFDEVHFVTLVPKTVQTYTTTDVDVDRDLDADSDLLEQVADVLGTLIADLQALGILA